MTEGNRPAAWGFLAIAASTYVLMQLVPVLVTVILSDPRQTDVAAAMLLLMPLVSLANFAVLCAVPLWVVYRLGQNQVRSLALEIVVLGSVGLIVAAALAFSRGSMVRNGVVYAVDGAPTLRFAVESALNLVVPYLTGALVDRPRPWRW